MWNVTYQIIYDYCLEHDRVPPVKDVDGKRKDEKLSLIVGKYTDDYGRLHNALIERCQKLPEQPTLQYFCQILLNRKPTKDDRTYTPITL